jgi:O-antigen/teichoic acid export membrane protein
MFEGNRGAPQWLVKRARAYLEPVEDGPGLRLAGIVLLVAAIALTTLLGFIVYSVFSRGGLPSDTPPAVAVLLVALVALTAFCWQAGVRLTFNRPNHAGSLFSTLGWTLIGIGMAGVTALIVFAVLTDGGKHFDPKILLFALGMTAGCFALAYRAYRRRRRADAVPPRSHSGELT